LFIQHLDSQALSAAVTNEDGVEFAAFYTVQHGLARHAKSFDNIDHTLLVRAVRKHVTCKWALLYIERWLKAPMVDEEGERIERSRGTPQGGVVTPWTQRATSSLSGASACTGRYRFLT
jgi:hypothetical protein